MSTYPRLFFLQRHHDVSSVSGTGRVADGVLLPDGSVSVRWRGARPSLVHWSCVDDVKPSTATAGRHKWSGSTRGRCLVPKRPEDVLLDIVRGELGQGERRDGWTRYGAWWAERHDKPDWWAKQPWCAMFLAWAADRANLVPDVGDFAYTPTYADWFKDRSRWGQTPRKGAVVFFDWAGSKNVISAIDHGGIVEAVHRDGTLTTIECTPATASCGTAAPAPASPASATPTYSGVKPALVPELTWMEEIVKQLPTLRLGAKGWDVKTLFYLLHARGYGLNGGVDDTVFGDPLYDALKEFQKAAHLAVDGVCGPNTWAALLRVA